MYIMSVAIVCLGHHLVSTKQSQGKLSHNLGLTPLLNNLLSETLEFQSGDPQQNI